MFNFVFRVALWRAAKFDPAARVSSPAAVVHVIPKSFWATIQGCLG